MRVISSDFKSNEICKCARQKGKLDLECKDTKIQHLLSKTKSEDLIDYSTGEKSNKMLFEKASQKICLE